jgi:hypothetical protein
MESAGDTCDSQTRKRKASLLRLPYDEDNRTGLSTHGKRNPTWNRERKRWEIPYAWLNKLVESSLERWGRLYIIQPYREQEKCAPACWHAKGYECQCSCKGQYHGMGDQDDQWFVVGETFATRWEEKDFACRLLTVR